MTLLEEGIPKEGEGGKGKLKVQQEHAEEVLNKELHKPLHMITGEMARERRCEWFGKTVPWKETGGTTVAAQDQALATNWRPQMRNEQVSLPSRMCKESN